MNTNLPAIVITGASGFIGRHLVEVLREKFQLYCIARRSQKEIGIVSHPNITWIQADISNTQNINHIAKIIQKNSNVEHIIHLAGYYDFSMKYNIEYDKTNVLGTRNILELGKELKIKRFIFSSSLAACTFFEKGTILNEKSPLNANYYYAVSKRKGEEIVREYTPYFSTTIIRLAAVISDWCEYAPLYMFLETWLSKKWNSRVIGGKGESSITYIHINDLIKIVSRIIEKHDSLLRHCILIASPCGTVSHLDLYNTATKYYFGNIRKPIKIPKIIAGIGMRSRTLMGKIIKKEYFERPWMIKYIDTKLIVDNTYTSSLIEWKTTQRYDVLRRLLILIDKKKNNPVDWTIRNEAALKKISTRPNIIAYNIMIDLADTLIDKMLIYLQSPENRKRFSNYQKTGEFSLKYSITLIYQIIAINIKNKDKLLLNNYIKIITYRRFIEGFDVNEIVDFAETLISIIVNSLLNNIDNKESKKEIYDYLQILIQQIIDEIQDYYDFLKSQDLDKIDKNDKNLYIANTAELNKIIKELDDFFFDNEYFNLLKLQLTSSHNSLN